jgi:hypothetical protein
VFARDIDQQRMEIHARTATWWHLSGGVALALLGTNETDRFEEAAGVPVTRHEGKNRMSQSRVVGFVAALGFVALLASACTSKEGPAQKAGEKLDDAADKVSDTINPKGPVEKAGRAIDRATGN